MIEINNKTKEKVNVQALKDLVQKFFEYFQVINQNLSIALVGDEEMQELNKKWRGMDKPTDVLSWRSEETEEIPGEETLGEIIIDLNQISRQADELNKKAADELDFILVHGLLHLIGYQDEEEQQREEMISLGEKFLNSIK